MVQEYVNVLKNYANFSGRARRREFWMFFLANLIIGIVLGVLAVIPVIGNLLSTVYGLAVLIPSWAVAVRRLHDIGKSGWWYLIGFIPLVGGILLLIWACTDSKAEPNQWGASPKYGAPAEPVAPEAPVAPAAIVEEPVAPAAIVEEPVAPAAIAEEPAVIADESAQ